MTAITNSMFTTKPRIHGSAWQSTMLAASSQINEKITVPRPLYDGRTKFHHYIEDYRRQMICDVCTAIDVTKISQENLCCLNTTIILLIFSNMHGTLADDIKFLKEKEKNWNSPGSIVMSFRRLLWFWDKYYHKRAHDRLSLELSSRIPFHMFDAVVDKLVKDDGGEGSLCENKNWMREWEYLKPMFACRRSV